MAEGLSLKYPPCYKGEEMVYGWLKGRVRLSHRLVRIRPMTATPADTLACFSVWGSITWSTTISSNRNQESDMPHRHIARLRPRRRPERQNNGFLR